MVEAETHDVLVRAHLVEETVEVVLEAVVRGVGVKGGVVGRVVFAGEGRGEARGAVLCVVCAGVQRERGRPMNVDLEDEVAGKGVDVEVDADVVVGAGVLVRETKS